MNLFTQRLYDVLCLIYSPDKYIILVGDFNVDFSITTDTSTSVFQLLLGFGMESHVHGMTRVTSMTASQIDNIFTNITSREIEGEVYMSNISDHYGQIIKFRLQNKKKVIQYERKRTFSDNNIVTFTNYLKNDNFQSVYESIGVNEKYLTFYRIFYYYFDCAFPMDVRRENESASNWVNSDIKNYAKYIKDLYVWYKQTHSDLVFAHYKAERKEYRKYLSCYRKGINNNKILNSKNKTKSAWNIYKKETNKNKSKPTIKLKNNKLLIDDPQLVAEIFSDQFNLLCSPCNVACSTSNNNFPTLFLTPVSEQEIFNIIMNLPNKYSSGLDEIPVCVLKYVAESICCPLANIINECFLTGTFPSELKKAKLIPIHKKGDAHNPGNFRPVSLLSSVSKVFERAIYNRLMSFIEQQNILSPNQYGFRPKRSTELAIFNTIKFIMEKIDHNEKVAGLYFDLSKAFDTIDHSLLINKLEAYGIRGMSAKLIHSYLMERRQVVCVMENGKQNFSEPVEIQQGVPQGSILGPLLFLLYANSLSDGFVAGLACQYADDTSVILADPTAGGLSRGCSWIADQMQSWCQNNNLKLNVEKTGLIAFNKTKQNESLLVRLNIKSIPTSDNIKFLGVHIDPTLSWNFHIENLTLKLGRYCFLFRRLREVLSRDTIRTFYFACVQSIINYGILFWGASGSAINAFRAQKKIIRAIYKLHPRTSCKPFFSELGVPTVPSLYFQSLVIFVRKYPHFFQANSDNYTLDMSMITRGRGDLRIPMHNSTFFEKGPYYRGIKAYNMLPSHIKETTDLKRFKSKVAEFIMEKCFYSFNF